MTVKITFKVEDEKARELDGVVEERFKHRSEALREALDRFLDDQRLKGVTEHDDAYGEVGGTLDDE